jgi:hypothetical protein
MPYTPPATNAVNFALVLYGLPQSTLMNFDFVNPRTIGLSLAPTQAQSPVLVQQPQKSFSPTQAQAITLIKQPGKPFALTQAQAITLVKQIQKVFGTPAPLVIDTMDAISGWAASVDSPAVNLDTSIFEVGTGSIKMNGGSVAAYGSGMANTYTAMDLSGCASFNIWFRCTGNLSGVNTVTRPLAVRFGTSSSVYWEYDIPGNTLTDSTWQRINIPIGSFSAVGGISAWTAITRIEFAMETAGSGQLWVDDIEAAYSPLLVGTSIGNLVKQIGKIFAPTQAQSPTIVKQPAKILTATQGQSITLTPTGLFARTFSLTQTQAVSLAKQIGKVLTVGQAQGITLVKWIYSTLVLTQIQAISLAKQVGKSLTATQTQSPTVAKAGSTTLTTTQGQSPSLLKQVSTYLSAAQAQGVSLAKQVWTYLITSQAQSPTLSDVVIPGGRTLTTTQGQSVSLAQQTQKILSATGSQTATLASQKLAALTLSVTQSSAAKVVVLVGRTLAPAATPVVVLVKMVARYLPTTQSSAATENATIGTTLVTTQTQSITLAELRGKLLTATQSSSAFLSKMMQRIFEKVSISIPSVVRSVSTTLVTSVTSVPTLVGGFLNRRTLTTSQSSDASLTHIHILFHARAFAASAIKAVAISTRAISQPITTSALYLKLSAIAVLIASGLSARSTKAPTISATATPHQPSTDAVYNHPSATAKKDVN